MEKCARRQLLRALERIQMSGQVPYQNHIFLKLLFPLSPGPWSVRMCSDPADYFILWINVLSGNTRCVQIASGVCRLRAECLISYQQPTFIDSVVSSIPINVFNVNIGRPFNLQLNHQFHGSDPKLSFLKSSCHQNPPTNDQRGTTTS
jgi:hypothetical protein